MAGPLTFNEQLHDAMVRHQVGLLQFAGGVRNKIWKLLDVTEVDVRRQIEDQLRRDPGGALTPARLKRVEKLLADLRETRLAAWKDANATWSDEMKGLAVAEAGFTTNILNSTFPVELGLVMPDAARLRAIASSKPFMGATLKEWAGSQAKADIARIEQQIRIGLVQGEDIGQISRRVVGSMSKNGSDGVTAITRRQSEAITRTATNAIAAESRKELYAANADLMSGELFAATLDSKTTPICRAFDGNVYPVGEGPDLPLHWNERSLRLPIVDGEVIGDRPMRNFTEKSLLREYAEKNGLDKVPKTRDGLPRGTKGDFDAFARKRMRELTGIVPAKTTYQQWLSRQSPEFQDDILGPARGKLFRDGGITLDKFVSPEGKTLTLKELGEFDAQAFVDAGLDPQNPTRLLDPDQDAVDDAEEEERLLAKMSPEDARKAYMLDVLEATEALEKAPKKNEAILDDLTGLLQDLLEGKKPGKDVAGALDRARAIIAGGTGKVPKVIKAPKAQALRKEILPEPETVPAEAKLPKSTEATAKSVMKAIEKEIAEAEFGATLAEYEKVGKEYRATLKRLDSGEKGLASVVDRLSTSLTKIERKLKPQESAIRDLIHENLRVKKSTKIGLEYDARFSEKERPKAEAARDFLQSITSRSGRGDFKLHMNRLKNGERAYAETKGGRVFLTMSDGTDTYVHEMGHVLEAGPNSPVLRKAKAFLEKRGKADPKGLQPLAKLMRDNGYGDDEWAYRDDFIDPYMGKFYPDATELFSMAVEMLYREPLKLMRGDPEMFEWVIDVLRGLR